MWPNRQKGGFHRVGNRSAPDAVGTAHGEVTCNSPVEPSAFYRSIFQPATQAAGLGAVRLHDLRHSYARILAAQGTPVERVSAWMGHSSIVVTWSIYTHLFRGDDDHAAIAYIGEPTVPANVTSLPIAR